ncbi:diguanylate cyclase domain-containing protein [Ralstonia syzygii]|uniref:diguanylate cyclase domain-containing protein n=1 Tax=Ralstonia syzygii TaxID=28097 RepID=UPI0022B0E2AE|nr:diguanylate cyclase [Ralstonia syzygii]
MIAVAECLAKHVQRDSDRVAHYGGEAFAVLLPDTDMATAEKIGQRLCGAVAALAIPHAGSAVAGHVTISVGVAVGGRRMGCCRTSSLRRRTVRWARPRLPGAIGLWWCRCLRSWCGALSRRRAWRRHPSTGRYC